MKLCKSTPDGFFHITIESTAMDELDEYEGIPVETIEALIHELEMIAVELQQFLIESEKDIKSAN